MYRHHNKIAASGEGHKPELDRQKYLVESELAILSILYKLIIIIFRQDFSESDEEAELINVFNCRYWQTEIAFARMLGHSLMQPCVHDSEFGERCFVLFSSGFPTGHMNHEKIRCTRCLTRGCHIVKFLINLARWWEFQHWCASTANVLETR